MDEYLTYNGINYRLIGDKLKAKRLLRVASQLMYQTKMINTNELDIICGFKKNNDGAVMNVLSQHGIDTATISVPKIKPPEIHEEKQEWVPEEWSEEHVLEEWSEEYPVDEWIEEHHFEEEWSEEHPVKDIPIVVNKEIIEKISWEQFFCPAFVTYDDDDEWIGWTLCKFGDFEEAHRLFLKNRVWFSVKDENMISAERYNKVKMGLPQTFDESKVPTFLPGFKNFACWYPPVYDKEIVTVRGKEKETVTASAITKPPPDFEVIDQQYECYMRNWVINIGCNDGTCPPSHKEMTIEHHYSVGPVHSERSRAYTITRERNDSLALYTKGEDSSKEDFSLGINPYYRFFESWEGSLPPASFGTTGTSGMYWGTHMYNCGGWNSCQWITILHEADPDEALDKATRNVADTVALYASMDEAWVAKAKSRPAAVSVLTAFRRTESLSINHVSNGEDANHMAYMYSYGTSKQTSNPSSSSSSSSELMVGFNGTEWTFTELTGNTSETLFPKSADYYRITDDITIGLYLVLDEENWTYMWISEKEGEQTIAFSVFPGKDGNKSNRHQIPSPRVLFGDKPVYGSTYALMKEYLKITEKVLKTTVSQGDNILSVTEEQHEQFSGYSR